ncbi:MAG: hypothetical protein HY513_02285 [Candidatus Aenigmarchaeota archaeon]|nr:hypothetical protein [Candidatus Aenigmarchaeota archaeon]
MLKQLWVATALAGSAAAAEAQTSGYFSFSKSHGRTFVSGGINVGCAPGYCGPWFAVPRYFAAGFPYHPGCNIPVFIPSYEHHVSLIPETPSGPTFVGFVPAPTPYSEPSPLVSGPCEIVQKEAKNGVKFVDKTTVIIDGKAKDADCGLDCQDGSWTLFDFKADEGETEVLQDRGGRKKVVTIHVYDKSQRDLEKLIPGYSCNPEGDERPDLVPPYSSPAEPPRVRTGGYPGGRILGPPQFVVEAAKILEQALPEGYRTNRGAVFCSSREDLVVTNPEGIPIQAFRFRDGMYKEEPPGGEDCSDRITLVSEFDAKEFCRQLLDALPDKAVRNGFSCD